jgi:hypothetical protein
MVRFPFLRVLVIALMTMLAVLPASALGAKPDREHVRFVDTHQAGAFVVEEVVDEAAGTLTLLFTYKGLPNQLRTARGPVVLRDVGFITFAEVHDLDTGEILSFEIVVNKGPHPEAESDFTIFCEAFTEALG